MAELDRIKGILEVRVVALSRMRELRVMVPRTALSISIMLLLSAIPATVKSSRDMFEDWSEVAS